MNSRTIAFAVAFLVALVLFGCGGSGGGSTNDTSTKTDCATHRQPLNGAWETFWGEVKVSVESGPEDTCHAEMAPLSLFTGDNVAAGIIWEKVGNSTSVRELSVHFMVPYDLAAWTHIGNMAAFDIPDPGVPTSGFGRIGSAVYANGLHVEYMEDFDSGCKGSEENLFAKVDIPDGLRTGTWYKNVVRITDLDGTLLVETWLYNSTTDVLLAETQAEFPGCYPEWYSDDTVRFLIGVQSYNVGHETVIYDPDSWSE
jgi:hypothetical protein